MMKFSRASWLRVPAASLLLALLSATAHAQSRQPWHFAVSGDSRNCGDVVMPAIAESAKSHGVEFYWHLGDFRAIYDFDQDYKCLRPATTIIRYLGTAWDDFLARQIAPFGATPVFLGIGNHELIPPKTRSEFIAQFADWLNAPAIREQRLRDDPNDHRVKTWYHWVKDGIDFVNLDNASPDQFEPGQMKWAEALIARDEADTAIRALVVGMHEALPDSLSASHSMNESLTGTATGREIYSRLLEFQQKSHKPVYLLASHSHFYLPDAFNSEYWRTHGGVLPGWIIGTAGAERYALPPEAKGGKTNVYGYLLATVDPDPHSSDPVHFEFQLLEEKDIPPSVIQEFSEEFVRAVCFEDNTRAK